MVNTATVYKADGTIQELDHRPTLSEAQGIVGGYIEFLQLGHNCTLVVDEEGKLKNKPINYAATNMIRKIYYDRIVGDVILLKGWRTVES